MCARKCLKVSINIETFNEGWKLFHGYFPSDVRNKNLEEWYEYESAKVDPKGKEEIRRRRSNEGLRTLS